MSEMALSDEGRRPFDNEDPAPEQPESPSVSEPSAETEVERRARSMGWAPREEWRGDPARWKTAEEFVAFADNTSHVGVLRENMHRMEQRLGVTNKELQEANSLIKDQAEVIKQLKGWADRSEEAGYERARRELLEKQRAAVASADVVAHDAVTRDLEKLDEQHRQITEPMRETPPPPPPPSPPAPEQPATSPEMQEWVSENGWWFFSNEEMKQSAIGLFGGITASHPDWGDKQKLGEVLRRIKLMYPERFRNARREAPPVVAEPSAPPPPGGTRPGEKFTYNQLSAEEKAACDKFCRTIPGYTKEKYVEEFLRQEAIRKERSGG